MKLSAITLLVLFSLFALSHVSLAQPQPSGPPPQMDGFKPMDTLPQAETLPAARLLIVAYAFVWVAVFLYVWSLWKRLGKVESELQQLAKRTGTNVR